MVEPALAEIIRLALARLQGDLERLAPATLPPVRAWQQALASSAEPAAYFTHPLAFPALLLPWWLERSLRGAPDPAFQAELAYSTINGYYFIRLIDNLLDGHATVERQLLPVLAIFHTNFQRPYQGFFAGDHPFWDDFRRVWFRSAEAALEDAGLAGMDEAQFRQVAGQKVCAAKIPLAAVAYHAGRPELIAPWANWVDLFGCWHQLLNDLLGWQRDHARGTPTYFLAEVERQRRPDEPVAGWVARAGYAWAVGTLESWLPELHAQAAALASPELTAYLHARTQMLREQNEAVRPGLAALARLAAGKMEEG